MGASSNGDQRVTNAKIYGKLEGIDSRLGNIEEQIKPVVTHVVRCSTRWELHDKEHAALDLDGIKRTNRVFDALAGAAGVVAAVIASAFGNK